MNIKENMQKIGRAIKDELFDRISDPKLVAVFPAHLPECTRSKFLQQTIQANGVIPNWGNAGLRTEIISITTTCSECGGSLIQK